MGILKIPIDSCYISISYKNLLFRKIPIDFLMFSMGYMQMGIKKWEFGEKGENWLKNSHITPFPPPPIIPNSQFNITI